MPPYHEAIKLPEMEIPMTRYYVEFEDHVHGYINTYIYVMAKSIEQVKEMMSEYKLIMVESTE